MNNTTPGPVSSIPELQQVLFTSLGDHGSGHGEGAELQVSTTVKYHECGSIRRHEDVDIEVIDRDAVITL